jgi:hypothetical protein
LRLINTIDKKIILIIDNEDIDSLTGCTHALSPNILIAPKRIKENEVFMTGYYPSWCNHTEMHFY